MKKKDIVLTIIYSFIAIPLICLLIYIEINYILFDFTFDFDVIFLFVRLLIELLVLILPYILLTINKRKKSKSLTNGIFIYELIIIVLSLGYAFLLWFIWPTIKKSINNCWCVVQNSDGTTSTGCCD